MLEKIIDRLELGVLVLDGGDCISRLNKCGQEILSLSLQQVLGKQVQIKKIGSQILDMTEYRLAIDEQSISVVGDLYGLELEPYSKVFIFSSADLMRQNAMGLAGLKKKSGLNRVISISAEMSDVKSAARQIAVASSNTLITGEPGSGKKMFARIIHEESTRAGNPFVAVNCSFISEGELELELWGSVRNAAFPKGKVGKFELAASGTLYLDEVGDLPLTLQRKLFDTLEKQAFTKVGATKASKIKFRLVSSTKRDLQAMIENGSFIRGLYYKLNVLPLHLPPLRERKADIRLLAMMQLNLYSRQLGKRITHIEDSFWASLEAYDWPGNVSELNNTIEYVVNIVEYPNILRGNLLFSKLPSAAVQIDEADYNLERIEAKIIQKAIEQYGAGDNSKEDIAQKLGIGIATLYRKLKKYGIK